MESSDLSYQAMPWKPYLGHMRCSCSKKVDEKKLNANRTKVSEGKPIKYPNGSEETNKKLFRTFQINYDGTLSLGAKSILNSFSNKYIYYAIDDLLYLLNPNSKEREILLAFLYSAMMSIHNNLSVNFFNIWVDAVYFNDISKKNRFLIDNSKDFKPVTVISLSLYYKSSLPIKKSEPIW